MKLKTIFFESKLIRRTILGKISKVLCIDKKKRFRSCELTQIVVGVLISKLCQSFNYVEFRQFIELT